MFFRGKRFGVDVSLRFTGLHYEAETDALADADASNVGALIGIDYVLCIAPVTGPIRALTAFA